MTDTRFQAAAVLVDEIAEGGELEALVAGGAASANEYRQNLRNLRTSLMRVPPVITLEEARAHFDQLISGAAGAFAPLAARLRAARGALL